MSATLAAAEKWMRYVAAKPDGMDTGESFRLVIEEYDRRYEKLAAIQAMLDRLRPELPQQLFAELAAHIYVLPPKQMTPADVRRGQEIAVELANSDAARWAPETGDPT